MAGKADLEEQKQKKTKNFMVQGAILGAASIIVRLIGVIYRIPLTNTIGDIGIGYYSVAFDIYQILLLLSSYSLPLAVSKMVSARVALEQHRRAKKIFLSALGFAIIVGLAAFCVTFFLADFFAGTVMKTPQAAVALKVLAFALIILSPLGVLRGFFQGLGDMVPTAVSNIFEQIINAIISVVAAVTLFAYGKTMVSGSYAYSNAAEAFGAAGGTLGTVSGAFSALVILAIWIILYNRKHRADVAKDTSEDEQIKDIVKILILTIVPVILNTAIYNLSSIVDKFIFSNIMLAKGMDADIKDGLIGMFSGKYWLIVNIPIALSSALASSLIPSVVASKAKGDNGGVISKINSAIKITTIIAFPCAAGIGFLARPIINLLFPTSSDPDKVALMLMVGCLTVVFYCISTITNSILQGIDKMRIPVIHSAIALLINAGVLTALLYLTDMDVFCWIISDMLFALLMCIMNAFSLKKYLGYRQEVVKTFIVPIISAIVMGVIARVVYQVLKLLLHSNLIGVIAAAIAAVIVYAVMLLLLKIIDEDELKRMPMGTKLVKVCKKLHLMK